MHGAKSKGVGNRGAARKSRDPFLTKAGKSSTLEWWPLIGWCWVLLVRSAGVAGRAAGPLSLVLADVVLHVEAALVGVAALAGLEFPGTESTTTW